jgi:hypothetical protein
MFLSRMNHLPRKTIMIAQILLVLVQEALAAIALRAIEINLIKKKKSHLITEKKKNIVILIINKKKKNFEPNVIM